MNALETACAEQRFDLHLALVRDHWTAVRQLWLGDPDCPAGGKIRSQLPPGGFWFGVGMPGLAGITPTRDGLFEFADDGRPAVIIPCYDTIPGILDANAERHVEHITDLVAVDLDRPDQFWLRRGGALILGNAYLEIAGQEGGPVPVFRNPLSWLKAGGAGIAILDWAWAPDLLLGFDLIAEDLDLGNHLEAVLAPEIWVRGAAA